MVGSRYLCVSFFGAELKFLYPGEVSPQDLLIFFRRHLLRIFPGSSDELDPFSLAQFASFLMKSEWYYLN